MVVHFKQGLKSLITTTTWAQQSLELIYENSTKETMLSVKGKNGIPLISFS